MIDSRNYPAAPTQVSYKEGYDPDLGLTKLETLAMQLYIAQNTMYPLHGGNEYALELAAKRAIEAANIFFNKLYAEEAEQLKN